MEKHIESHQPASPIARVLLLHRKVTAALEYFSLVTSSSRLPPDEYLEARKLQLFSLMHFFIISLPY